MLDLRRLAVFREVAERGLLLGRRARARLHAVGGLAPRRAARARARRDADRARPPAGAADAGGRAPPRPRGHDPRRGPRRGDRAARRRRARGGHAARRRVPDGLRVVRARRHRRVRGRASRGRRPRRPARAAGWRSRGSSPASSTSRSSTATASAAEPDPRLDDRKLGDDPYRVALPPGHRLARRREVALADLRDERFAAPRAVAGGLQYRGCSSAPVRRRGLHAELRLRGRRRDGRPRLRRRGPHRRRDAGDDDPAPAARRRGQAAHAASLRPHGQRCGCATAARRGSRRWSPP